ncbi:MAG: hypothetical protein HY812_15605 [Planctomycetes bacterium]|nr:hypothetical protein [Planctomycetota bacterium]
MDLPGELDFARLTPEEKYWRAVPGYMKRLARLYQAIHERFGEAGLELIRDVSREFGAAIGQNARKGGEIKGVAAVGRYLLKVFDMVCDDWEVREFTPERLVIGVRRCPYPFTEERICRAHTCMEESLVAALDDTLEYKIGRSIPSGDSFCEHILRRRAAAPSAPSAAPR